MGTTCVIEENVVFVCAEQWNIITTWKRNIQVAINHNSIRHSYDLALLDCADYYPSLPRAIDHLRNDPFPLAWDVGEDAKSEASDQVVAERGAHSGIEMVQAVDPVQDSG